MRKEKEIRKKLAELFDERSSRRTVMLSENTSMALTQLALESKISVLKWVLEKP